MHLISTPSDGGAGGYSAIDTKQSAGDIVILTAADSELACFSSAAAMMGDGFPKIRMQNLLKLRHPFSVDLYVENIISKAKFVCVILLGGKSYWSYGIDEIANCARENNISFVAIENGDTQDEALINASNISEEYRNILIDYLNQGGVENAVGFLKTASKIIGFGAGEISPPITIAECGHYFSDQNNDNKPNAVIIFYRTILLGGKLSAIDAMITSLKSKGFKVTAYFVRSLREIAVKEWLAKELNNNSPDIIINTTSFASSSTGENRIPSVLEVANCPILQCVFAGISENEWRENSRGLGQRDIAMNIALPEVDGRIFTRAIAFKAEEKFDNITECEIIVPHILGDRLEYVAQLALNWAILKRLKPKERKIALILANYPSNNGRIGNGVGLDTPQSVAEILGALKSSGYDCENSPVDGAAIINILTNGISNDLSSISRNSEIELPLEIYKKYFSQIPLNAQQAMNERWGKPEDDKFCINGKFRLMAHIFGNIIIAIQPSRGYNINPKETYHDPALVPPHYYLAFHTWLNEVFKVNALVHVGKHGNLEWLPGKAVSLSSECFPEIISGPVPQIYPFIVNDPGEGTQAKRRISAIIIDHLTPPLTRAETYGYLKELEALVDEYYLAAGMDYRRLEHLRNEILDLAKSSGLDKDAGAVGNDDDSLSAIDNYLCELKEMQIRDGLHIFTKSPIGILRRDLIIALARNNRGDNINQSSILHAICADLNLDFDPFNCRMGDNWLGKRHELLRSVSNDVWRTNGDTIERLELLAIAMVENNQSFGENTAAVLHEINNNIAPRIDACGDAEKTALLNALNGNFILPGPSGAPTRGRPEVLPTGRNFYSVDPRAIPTKTAWNLGYKSAQMLMADYLQREGEYPKAIALSAWGTANMRTGGDDIAQALALMGVEPIWEDASGRIVGFKIIEISQLGRPRVDVTFRISGFFRDAFPEQIDLLDKATRAIMNLDESKDLNPAAANYKHELDIILASGVNEKLAAIRSGARVFGAKSGAYGAGLQAMIDEKLWHSRKDLAEAYLDWGSYIYGNGIDGDNERETFKQRLKNIDAVVQNQDNREHDILDSDDYYQFEGGIAAAIEHLSGQKPISYHNDNSRPETPIIRTLEDELGRVIRARLTNPKWIEGVMRHGYKGAFEIAASVDYLFAFAATTDAIKDYHFDAIYSSFIEDDKVREFMRNNNPDALKEMSARLLEALDRNLWRAKSNIAAYNLGQIIDDIKCKN